MNPVGGVQEAVKDPRLTDDEHQLLEGWKMMVEQARKVFETSKLIFPDNDEVLGVHLVMAAARKRVGMDDKEKEECSLAVMREGYARIEAARAKLVAS